MDRREEASIVVKKINEYQDNKIEDAELIKAVCHYFDKLKNQSITQAELKFMKYISNVIGIPHYYDILNKKFGQNTTINACDMTTMASLINESSLHLSESYKLHRYQKEILDKFEKNKQNRYFLSASTSFGKTHLVYDIIEKMEYKNIVLIFPTVALLSENLERILTENNYKYIKTNYKIHTLSETDGIEDKNIFIYTPERFLSFTDKNKIDFDFVFIDEIYKLDNDYIIDNTTKENERDVAYRLASFEILQNVKDVLLAGPYIEYDTSANNSFKIFLDENKIDTINFNNIEIVNKNHFLVNKDTDFVAINENRIINFSKPKDKNKQLIDLLTNIYDNQENSIIYCCKPYLAEQYAQKIMDNIDIDVNTLEYTDFIEHIKRRFYSDWIVCKALEHRIGLHHGLVPKYIQKEIINLFNDGKIKFLLSTTTITEGVNTTAKNLVVMHNSKGSKPLKPFDAKNIAGRAGRFLEHYSGRVFAFIKDFEDTLNTPEESIKHKNYDKDTPKDDIDYFCTQEKYLNEQNIQEKNAIIKKQRERKLPNELFQQFKAVSRNDKIFVYDKIKNLNSYENKCILNLISKTNTRNMNIDFDGFQVILNTILQIVKPETELYHLISNKSKSSYSGKEYSILCYLLYFYLKDGFRGAVDNKLNKKVNIDTAMRDTANFVYNILKYHVVKYLEVFNLMYKYINANDNISKIDDVTGIDKLLTKLEYNAISQKGRQVSDYGVPLKVLDYYESLEGDKVNDAYLTKYSFDNYENYIYDKMESLLQNE